MESITVVIKFYIQTLVLAGIEEEPKGLAAVRFSGEGETRSKAIIDCYGGILGFLQHLPEGTTIVEHPKEDHDNLDYFLKYADLF